MAHTYSKLAAIALTGALLTTLGGCAKYKSSPLEKPASKPVENNDIKVAAQTLSNSDCKKYFSRNIGKKGYQAVQLCIQNNSDQKMVLNTADINLPMENRDHVASRCHIDMTSRVVGWGVAGLFFTPFFIPAAVEAINSSKANKKLDADFESRILDTNKLVEIKPHTTLNSVFFVRTENMSHTLEFDLMDNDTQMTTNFELRV